MFVQKEKSNKRGSKRDWNFVAKHILKKWHVEKKSEKMLEGYDVKPKKKIKKKEGWYSYQNQWKIRQKNHKKKKDFVLEKWIEEGLRCRWRFSSLLLLKILNFILHTLVIRFLLVGSMRIFSRTFLFSK